ncbi:putative transcription factor C3H family [Helianthus anomalus]
MVGGTANQPQQQQQAPQLANQSSAAHTATSEEDEVLKRNTDCVYFLASPLTCKKGSECEYRHSDIARVNPRDCWYWLNGNCLNPKCAFRHPPLDGLVGPDAPTPMGPPAPAPAPVPHSTPYATPKQGVPCIFFQKGYCLKGHLCPFLHGPPNLVINKPTQPGPTNPVTELPKMAQQVTIQKPVESRLPQVKQPPLPSRTVVDKKIAPPARLVPAVLPPVMNDPPSNQSNRSAYHGYHASNNERVVSGKDTDEYSRELSPGFDVLVDNEHEDSRPYYDIDHVDRDMYREHRDYDHYNERDGRFDVERIDHPEKRPYPRNDRENESDLRHRISKQRRGIDTGSRSVGNRESHADRMPRRDRDRDSDSDRDSRRHLDQGSLSSRLRGRIKIPGRSGRSVSPVKENNSRVEREIDVERRHISRYSPGRPLSINQTRLGDRITDNKFAGPKRLSELKGVRTEHQPNDEQSLGKRKHPKMEDELSFEGPKSLSEILKRKRGVSNDTNNNNNEVNNNNNNNTKDDNQKKIETIPAAVSADLDAENDKDKPLEGNNVNYGGSEVENEGGMVEEDALLDEELEAYDENRDGDNEYEYEEGEEDYNMEEGEEEYVDEEDEYGNKESAAVYS